MAEKFVQLVGGIPTEKEGLTTSTGAASAGRVVALNSQGDIDQSMLPPGVAPDIATLVCAEAVTAGDFVNVFNDAGTPKVRRADATTAGKHAHGFVLEDADLDATAAVYFEAVNNMVTGHVAGDVFLDTTPGAATATPPNGSGNIVQRLGVASSATSINVEFGQYYVLA